MKFRIKYNLKTKLALSYLLMALMLVGIISFLTNYFLEGQFRSYIIHQQSQKNEELARLISQQYDKDIKDWDKQVIENIGINALEQSLIIKVKNVDGKTIWDATEHNHGMCTQMLDHMAKNMTTRYPNMNGGYTEASYSLKNDQKTIGNLMIGYYGPFFLNDEDLAFINTLNTILIGTGVFSLLLALILGMLMAKRISSTISSVINAAYNISKGNFNHRVKNNSNTLEIVKLTSTINDLAETLGRQENLRKSLTADVAHELRTPLATLQSHMEAMIDGIWETDAERLKGCLEEILRLSRLVGDLERLAKYDGENLVLNKTNFDISEIIKTFCKNFEAECHSKNIDIKLDLKKKIIFADYDKLGQVIFNLLSNALKYTPANGCIKIATESKLNSVEIRIEDTGIGIAPEDLPYIFERFYRAEKSRNRSTGGSGIGLAIVKSIIEAHNGRISAKSEIGKGSVFIIVLPE